MKIPQVLFIYLIFLFSGCLPSLKSKDIANLSSLEIKIYNEWLYSLKIENINIRDEAITRPPGISQLIFSLFIPTEDGLSVKTHCVYYKVPYKEIIGQLRIDELKSAAVCPKTPIGEAWVELNSLKDFIISYKNFKLDFQFNLNGQKKSWQFLLPNITEGFIHEKYQAIKERKLFPGLSILKISEENFDSQTNKYFGKLSDRFSRGNSIRCFQVDKNCKNIGEDRCDECRYGWYQVVDYQCPQGGSRFCGQNHCGEKNEPACPRGTKVVGEDQLGICQSDLTPVWNADHLLVCQ